MRFYWYSLTSKVLSCEVTHEAIQVCHVFLFNFLSYFLGTKFSLQSSWIIGACNCTWLVITNKYYSNNYASFYLWWKKWLVKHRKFKYYNHNCLQRFLLFFMSLLTAPIVKTIIFGWNLLFLSKTLLKLERLSIPNLNVIEKIRKVFCYNLNVIEKIGKVFCYYLNVIEKIGKIFCYYWKKNHFGL